MKLRLFMVMGMVATILQGQGSLLLVGGGGENYNDWSDIPYRWFVQAADSGKIINIDVATTSDWYPAYFRSFGAAQSSRSLQIATLSAANDSATYYELISARGIFIEGGDQWTYVTTWKGTLVEDAIHYVFQQGGAIGGTSAGLAVLGDVCISARYGTLYPEDAAYNPFHYKLTLEDDFLHVLPGCITDSHFLQRGRLGRLVPMLARRFIQYGEDLTGIGVDEKTALCVGPDRVATAYGKASVTILYKSPASRVECVTGQPVIYTNLHCEQLIHGMVYNLANRQLIDAGPYVGAVSVPSLNAVYDGVTCAGNAEATADTGAVFITGLTSSQYNAWYGNLGERPGSSRIPSSVIIPKIWNHRDYYENRWVGALFGVARHPGYTAIVVDDQSVLTVSPTGVLSTTKLCYIFETQTVTHVGFRTPVVSNHPGMIGGRLHFLNATVQYDLANHHAISRVESDRYQMPSDFRLLPPYPNPFNATTLIRFELPRDCRVRIDVTDLCGNCVFSSGIEALSGGRHVFAWTPVGLGSGVYFIGLQTDTGTWHRKCVYLK